MTHASTIVFVTALLSSTAAMADALQEAQPMKPRGQPQQSADILMRLRKFQEAMSPQRQLQEEMLHEKQLQKQQQPVYRGKTP